MQSSIFADLQLPALPYPEDCIEDYRRRYNQEQYPLILSTGSRKSVYFCAEGRQINSLRALQQEPQVMIHPREARDKNIAEGDEVRIFSPFGSCTMKAKISEAFPAGIVHGDFGWWFPERPAAEPDLYDVGKANINGLFPSGLQGESGMGYPFRAFICQIEKP